MNKEIPKVICTVPVYKSVEALPFMHFLLFASEVGKAEMQGAYKVRWNVGGPGVRTSLVRNSAAQIAIDSGADYLLFIDDDMLVPPFILAKLLSLDKPIATPIFFRSGPPYDPLVFDLVDEIPTPMMKYPVDQVFLAPGGIGTGVMLIKTEVLRAVGAPYFYYPEDPSKGMDLEFCRRAREAGYDAWCDSRLLVKQMGNSAPVGMDQWVKRRANG